MAFIEANSEQHKRELSAELSLDSSDIRSHAWYHGSIPRIRAEELVAKNEQFLVRDCTSRPGDYVLTCRWNNHCLHFVINKVILQPYTVYERIQYTFEDDSFDTVPDLVTFYVGNRRPISVASGAIISRPINRTMPLSFYAAKYCIPQNDYPSLNRDSMITKSPPISLNKYQSALLSERPLSRLSINSQQEEPPPKPKRDSLIKVPLSDKTEPIYINCNGNDYDMNERENLNENIDLHSIKTANDDQQSDENFCPIDSSLFRTIPIHIASLLHSSSNIDPQNYFTFLLAKDNKPLEMSAVNKVRSLLLETGARILANHITKVDLDFIKHFDKEANFGLGIKSGLELVLLPHGGAYRDDILDRAECFKYFVAASLLICNDDERVLILDKWIQTAIEIKTGLGNLMAFRNIMAALALPQISRLQKLWLSLRQRFTSNAVVYESKLRPTLKAVIDCNEPLAPNTTFPYILTMVEIIQKHYKFVDETNAEMNEEEIAEKYQSFKFDFPWETSSSDFGLNLFFSHLEAGRQIVNQCNLFKRNSEIVLDGVVFEELLSDIFTTEFHRRFLWGYRGCIAAASERFSKFEQVLTLLSAKCESNSSSV
ncbi:SH2 domain-containing protein 3C-like protein [Dinothrombium tinctorium]|uniref:SH2 domain-containing protein 3C-like protein n=1 Tax=Dinothrombium tinctorium TaxID=1965070 RepID=A0A3S3P898_9ACAR|nr:SH2 domain-containing protein 3C-like protein [Dinothrombium tinctorium]RWS10297.1 SH2 domain-containing protein 3C-like protein [Dinothrombium tinctorium]RWS10304.1 SH2 domain-containing protein 3C-like protein [Dinothrombium tinctorium]